ncbi:permease-like cell division protein FtsX [Micromonospora sp. NPDC048999]|uniref:permease-like cell division protein FtsX n=1 Tax=Micromonospora sp. NPDC048999 TaxID=3155391 RepID=UPI0033E6DA21
MATGTSLRRRRHRLAAAGAAGMVTITALGVAYVATPPDGSVPAATVPAGLAMLVNPTCKPPARGTATDVSIFLTSDVTDQQRGAVKRALEENRAVHTIVFISHDEAYARFSKLYEEEPDLVASVQPSQLPESFRIKMAGRSQYAALAAHVKQMPGVDEIVGSLCPAGANVWADR